MFTTDTSAAADEVRGLLQNADLLMASTTISNEDSLFDAGVLDSLQLIGVVMLIEEHFGVKVRDDDLTPENFDSIAAIAGFVSRGQLAA